MKTFGSDLVVISFICCLISNKAMILQTDSNGIYTIPTKMIDEADLLEEHGRFMLANMNPTIDPCENFYEYACGNWVNNSMVPLLARNHNFFESTNMVIDELILEFLKNKTVMDENTAETKIKQLFDSCINMSQDLSQAYKTIYNSIKEPILKDGENLDWMVLNFYLENSPNPLLPLTITYNSINFMYEIVLKNPSEELSPFKFANLSKDFKFENEKAIEEEWNELLYFEKKLLASVTTTKHSKYESLNDFLETHNSSDVNFERFFDLAFNGTTKNSWKISHKITNFTDIFIFLNKSDTGTIFKYVKWRVILKFYEMLQLKKDETKEKKCKYVAMQYFSNALVPWFIETTFDKDRRADALLISKHVKDTFYNLIDQTTWLDSKTKSEAKSKLRAMDFILGYTDDMIHSSKMTDKFKDVNITKNFWVNLMNLDANKVRDLLRKTGKSYIVLDLDIYESNAHYFRELNLAFIAINLSQLPMYHIKLPYSLKFGGIGSVVGHEMAHGFDSDCYEYDYDGKKRNWWSPESLRNFKERYQCLESQYNKFIYEGLRTNGKQTSGDNIADNVGLKIAFKSYQRFLGENSNLERGKDKPLPGVDFTNNHLFFLKFAQSWCNGENENEQMYDISHDDHSLNEFRVVGTLMNMPEFSEEFNCALGTNMNPLRKCIIYGKD